MVVIEQFKYKFNFIVTGIAADNLHFIYVVILDVCMDVEFLKHCTYTTLLRKNTKSNFLIDIRQYLQVKICFLPSLTFSIHANML